METYQGKSKELSCCQCDDYDHDKMKLRRWKLGYMYASFVLLSRNAFSSISILVSLVVHQKRIQKRTEDLDAGLSEAQITSLRDQSATAAAAAATLESSRAKNTLYLFQNNHQTFHPFDISLNKVSSPADPLTCPSNFGAASIPDLQP